MTFHELGLDESILKSIDEFGFTTPTPIQAGAIPFILDGRDVIGSAQTGTGKTAAYALPILHRLGGHKEGAAPRCDATPTVHTGRRLCRCRPKSDVCSRQCVAALAQCLASDEDRVEREEAAREEFAPCLDNPAWWEM
ncbi:MAG: DEAD/DEAH box helicase, partial [Opitutales bacterium]|nr:DEAD/DEAH box helicase [Opitutales bacterium]